jgi:ribosome-binding protein aMBF1 (putative translation factor)
MNCAICGTELLDLRARDWELHACLRCTRPRIREARKNKMKPERMSSTEKDDTQTRVRVRPQARWCGDLSGGDSW